MAKLISQIRIYCDGDLVRETFYDTLGHPMTDIIAGQREDYSYNDSGEVIEKILICGNTRERSIYEYAPDGGLVHVYSQWEVLVIKRGEEYAFVPSESLKKSVIEGLDIPFLSSDKWISWPEPGRICEHLTNYNFTDGSVGVSRKTELFENNLLKEETFSDEQEHFSYHCWYSYFNGSLFSKVESFSSEDGCSTSKTNYVDGREFSRRENNGTLTAIHYEDNEEGDWICMTESNGGHTTEIKRIIEYR